MMEEEGVCRSSGFQISWDILDVSRSTVANSHHDCHHGRCRGNWCCGLPDGVNIDEQYCYPWLV